MLQAKWLHFGPKVTARSKSKIVTEIPLINILKITPKALSLLLDSTERKLLHLI